MLKLSSDSAGPALGKISGFVAAMSTCSIMYVNVYKDELSAERLNPGDDFLFAEHRVNLTLTAFRVSGICRTIAII